MNDAVRLAAIETLDACCDHLAAKGVALPSALKRRDKREPGRKEKELAEDRLFAVIRRRWKRQAERLQARIALYYPTRKAAMGTVDDLLSDFDWDDEESAAELFTLLVDAARGGVSLFGESVNLSVDYTMTNTQAARWAREYVGELIGGIDKTTMQSVRETIAGFVETPGMTIGMVMDGLPFDEQRANRVAVTEITRAYAEGQKLAGVELTKQFPDVRVVKTWFTNNDDRVCEICGPLDGVEVAIDESFASGIDQPPAHVSCRCWTSGRTRIGEEQETTINTQNVIDLSRVNSYDDLSRVFDRLDTTPHSVRVHGVDLKDLNKATLRNVDIYYNNASRKQAESVSMSLELFRRNNGDSVFDKLYGEIKTIAFTDAKHISGKNVLATGGQGKILVYNNQSIAYDELLHEAGHTAGNKDQIVNALRQFTEEGELSPTGYGRVNIDEDIAETIRTYFMEPEKLMQDYNNRYQLMRDFFND